MDVRKKKEQIIAAGFKSVDELVAVAKEKIITGKKDEDLSPDRLKTAAAAKKLCILDAFDILKRIEEEQNMLDGKPKEKEERKRPTKGFAEKIAEGN